MAVAAQDSESHRSVWRCAEPALVWRRPPGGSTTRRRPSGGWSGQTSIASSQDLDSQDRRLDEGVGGRLARTTTATRRAGSKPRNEL